MPDERAPSDDTVDGMHTIGRRLVVIGDVSSHEDLTIEGRVQGQVSVSGATLTIGAEAHVDADVRAARVVVLGHLRGSVAATERVELGASSSVHGDMHADQIVIGEGAHFTGNIDMGRRTLAARVAEYRAGRAEASSRT
jgi:cytoskeletal protein CcmA (bactofilin family)